MSDLGDSSVFTKRLNEAQAEIASLRAQLAEAHEANLANIAFAKDQVAQLASARKAAIEECAKYLERGGFRYSQGFDIIARIRELAETDDFSQVSKPSYCALCDLEHKLHEDAQGFHHVVKGERVACSSALREVEK